MIPVGIALVLLLLLAGEAVLLWADQIHRHREERAYWAVKAARPELFDWAKECEEFGCHEEDTP